MSHTPINYDLELKAIWLDVRRVQNLHDNVLMALQYYVVNSNASRVYLTILDNEIDRRK